MQKQRKIKEKKITKYTLSLPAEIHQEVRDLAYRKNKSMAYVFQEAIEGYLEREKEK